MEGWAQTLRDDRSAADAYTEAAYAVLDGLDDRARAQGALTCRRSSATPRIAVALEQRLALLERRRRRRGHRALACSTWPASSRGALAARRCAPTCTTASAATTNSGSASPARAIAEYRSRARARPAASCPRSAPRAGSTWPRARSRPRPTCTSSRSPRSTTARAQHALLRELAEHLRHALDDLDGAVLALRRALKARPNEPSSLERLAELLARARGSGHGRGGRGRSRARRGALLPGRALRAAQRCTRRA